jgi:hypothetical protein
MPRPLGQALAVQRRRLTRGRGLRGYLDRGDPVQAKHPHPTAQAAPSHQVPVALGADEAKRLDQPRRGVVAVLVAVVQAEHAPLQHRLLDRAQHRVGGQLPLGVQ